MNTRFAFAVAALGMLAAPAMAQTGQTGSSSGSSAASGNRTMAQSPAQMEQKIQQDLTKAGYTDVHVMPGSFLVQAKDSQGNPTQMMITPGGVTAITALDAGSSSQGSSGNSSTSK